MKVFRERSAVAIFTERKDGTMALATRDPVCDENYRRLAQIAQLELPAPCFAQQQHHDQILMVERDTPPGLVGAADALITAAPGRPVGVFSADCLAVLLVSSEPAAVGAVHAGWRGTLLDIVGKTVARMHECLGVEPARLGAFLGPCIGPCCLEVGDEVVEQIRDSLPSGLAILSRGREKSHFDLRAVNVAQLLLAGVPATAIRHHDDCTRCRSGQYFSYRAERGFTGSQFAFACLSADKESAR